MVRKVCAYVMGAIFMSGLYALFGLTGEVFLDKTLPLEQRFVAGFFNGGVISGMILVSNAMYRWWKYE